MENQLSEEQLLLLNNLMYMTNEPPLQNIADTNAKTVEEFIEAIEVEDLVASKDYDGFITGEDWQNLIQAIKNDDQLMDLQIVATHRENVQDGSGGGTSAVFVDPSTNEAVVVFRGTTQKEWYDNFVGGGLTNADDKVSTQCQLSALAWFQKISKELELKQYDTITVTGHSKGGNKAKYITILDDSVDRCVSFDGQGFSDEFMMKYMAQISANQDKITNHNVESDFVNLLLNNVGETTFYEGYDYGAGGFLENHSPNTFFKFGENGSFELIEGTRDENMAVLDEFLNSYLRSMSSDNKQGALNLIGELVQGYYNKVSKEEYLDIMLNGDNVDHTAYLLAYLVEYQQENPELIDALNGVLAENGGESLSGIVNSVIEVVNSEDFDDMLEGAGFVADLVPEFAYGWLYDKFKLEDKLGVDMSGKDLKKLFGMISTASDEMENIEIKDNGADIKIASDVQLDPFRPERPVRPSLGFFRDNLFKPRFQLDSESVWGENKPLVLEDPLRLDDPLVLDEPLNLNGPQLRLFPDEIESVAPETNRAKLGRDFERC